MSSVLPTADEILRTWRVEDISEVLLPKLRAEVESARGDTAGHGDHADKIVVAAAALDECATLLNRVALVPDVQTIKASTTDIANEDAIVVDSLNALWIKLYDGEFVAALDMIQDQTGQEAGELKEYIRILATGARIDDVHCAQAVKALALLDGKSATDILVSKALCDYPSDADMLSVYLKSVLNLAEHVGADADRVLASILPLIPANDCLDLGAAMIDIGTLSKQLLDRWWASLDRPLTPETVLRASCAVLEAFPPCHGTNASPPDAWLHDVELEVVNVIDGAALSKMLALLRPILPTYASANIDADGESCAYPHAPADLPKLAKL